MNWNEFHDNVISWATDRGIIPNATPGAQMGKVLEEIAETWQAIIAKDEAEIKDGIGDVAVTLVIHRSLKGLAPFDEYGKHFSSHGNVMAKLETLTVNAVSCFSDNAITSLIEVSNVLDLSFMECCELAWNEIKDRKGYLDDQGVFHKESN